jgi:uncharacterized membrane protein YkoI
MIEKDQGEIMKKTIALFLFGLFCVGAAAAQSKQKYIGMKRAKAIASQQVAGKITGSEREKENGKMIYSFDIRGTDGKNHEVTIDAFTGEVLTREIETPADEAKEKAEDKKAKKKH